MALKRSPERTLSGKLYMEIKRSIVVSLDFFNLNREMYESADLPRFLER